MNRTTWLQDRRMLKFEELLKRWHEGSERQFRRYRRRYEDGLDGLIDRRLGARAGGSRSTNSWVKTKLQDANLVPRRRLRATQRSPARRSRAPPKHIRATEGSRL